MKIHSAPPPGSTEIRIPVERLGVVRKYYVGSQDVDSVYVYHRGDRSHQPLPKRDLMPAGLWELHLYIRAVSEVEGSTYEETVCRLREYATERLKAGPTVHGSCTDGADD